MGKKILLADDSITIQKVIELTFSDEDFDVVTVGNGRLALEKLNEVRPDIVLCDIIMPEKDGYEVCEQIKRSPSFSHVPVLLLTGAFEPFDQERAAKAGYDGSLAKPFEPETLIAKVRDLLARAPQRAAAPATPGPPPVVPFARPTAVPPPPPPRASATHPDTPSFIPDDSFDADVTTAPPMPPLAPMSEEESATLMAAPGAETLEAVETIETVETLDTDDEQPSTSTVMFKASDLPWNAASVPPPPPPPPPPAAPTPVPPVAVAAPPTPPSVEPAFVPDHETVFEPEQLDNAEVDNETAVFEEVIEEDLEFEGSAPSAVDDAEPEDTGSTMMFSGSITMPPANPPPAETSATTASFGAVEEQTFAESDFEPEPHEPEPEAITAPPAPAARASTPSSMSAFRPPAPIAPPPPAPPAPARVHAAPADSFADMAPPVPEPKPVPPSEAAAVSVPVEMVEKIAQRVVAQISEKVVREIAWEVIPDLAEALIKQEIERLKAELQKI